MYNIKKGRSMHKKNHYTLKESSLNYIFSVAAMLVLSFILFSIINNVVSSTGKSYEEVCNFNWVNYLNFIFSALSFFIVFFAYNLITKKNFVKASRLEFRFNYKILLLVLLLAIITVFASVNATNLYNYTAGIITSTNVTSSLGVSLNTFGDFCLVVLLCAFLPAVGEELVFRGIIYNGLREKFSAKTSILISALLFALIHFSIFKTFYQFVLGFVLGLIIYFTGSIIYCIIFHFFNNFIVLLISYISQGYSIFEFTSWGALQIILTILIFAIGVLVSFFIFKLINKISSKHKYFYRLEPTNKPLQEYYINEEYVNTQNSKTNKNNYIQKDDSGKPVFVLSLVLAVVLWVIMVIGG